MAPTPTELAQADLDRALSAHLLLSASSSSSSPESSPSLDLLRLDREAHVAFARRALKTLPSGYSSLGASRPWMLHWATHSLSLLDSPLSDDPREASRLARAIVKFLKACQCRETGGFGGGPGQEPHLATTYAAAATLVTLGGDEALEACDRGRLASFLLSCVVVGRKGGDEVGRGFRVCPGGEADVRGCYCALASSALLRLPAPADPGSLAEAAGLRRYLRDCQTVEGGLGGFPGGPEAHGGYAFCGAAAAALAAGGGGGGGGGAEGGDDGARRSLPPSSSSSPLDPRALLLWASRCQSPTCGGFAGRTNKLVDGCYSWWQGALFGMLAGGGGGGGGGGAGGAAASAAGAAASAGAASAVAPFPPFDASKLPPLPGLPPLPSGASKAPTATERTEEEAEAEAEAGNPAAAAAAALEEARAAARVRELLPQPSRSGDGDDAAASAAASPLCFDPLGLQMWILAYCQEPSSSSVLPSPAAAASDTQEGRRRRFRGGGLRDKPGKPPDHYHTCYCLSGLSAAQEAAAVVVGGEGNRLEKTHFLLNVVAARVSKAAAFFEKENNARGGEGKRHM